MSLKIKIIYFLKIVKKKKGEREKNEENMYIQIISKKAWCSTAAAISITNSVTPNWFTDYP